MQLSLSYYVNIEESISRKSKRYSKGCAITKEFEIVKANECGHHI